MPDPRRPQVITARAATRGLDPSVRAREPLQAENRSGSIELLGTCQVRQPTASDHRFHAPESFSNEMQVRLIRPRRLGLMRRLPARFLNVSGLHHPSGIKAVERTRPVRINEIAINGVTTMNTGGLTLSPSQLFLPTQPKARAVEGRNLPPETRKTTVGRTLLI